MHGYPSLTPTEIQAAQDELVTFPLNAESRGLTNQILALSGNGRVYGLTVHNTLAAAQYILQWDRNVLPADGAVPDMAYKVAGNDNLYLLWIPGRTFMRGAVFCNSTTDATKTIGAADCLFDVQYV